MDLCWFLFFILLNYIYIGLKIKPGPIKNKFDLLFIHRLIQIKNSGSVPMINAKNSILISLYWYARFKKKIKKIVPSYFI